MLERIAQRGGIGVRDALESEAGHGVDLVDAELLAGGKSYRLLLTLGALILVEAYEEKLFLAARNIPHVEVMAVSALDPLSLVKHDKVVATVGALKLLDQRLGGAA